jgi:hypothetical protein
MILTHGGLILLLGSELTTAAFATEGNMSIDEKSSSNFIERMRDYELAVIDPGPKDHNSVTVIPDSVLFDHQTAASGNVKHADLPFEVRVNRWMDNSTLRRARPGDNNVATAGLGRRFEARRRPPASGASASQQINVPSAYITLLKDGDPLGTYMVTTLDNASPSLPHQPQTVNVEGETYKIDLRFEREYKPYTFHLKDFQHKKFAGTDKPKAFKSIIRLEDPKRNEDRQVLISMNNPLHYRGETFYQSAFMPGDSGTILQVVDNPAWFMPYLSCGMMALGLLVHFGASLKRFLRRQRG